MIQADQWQPADGLSLEPNALTAVKDTLSNVALTAGPGAGKTEMLAQRADFLLRTSACRYPKRILAISFKVDASRNLRARVEKRCGSDLASRLDSHTFHAFAKRIIDRFRPALTGIDVLDPDYEIAPNRIERRSITFADMVPLAATIIGFCNPARNAIRHTYSHVFLDEFQDATGSQYDLIRACFQGTPTRLTAVGDTKQCIMRWAGALEGIFERFATDFNAQPLNLYQNFRSAPRLRRMQNAMVRRMDPPAALDESEIHGDAGELSVLRFADDRTEAAYLADSICSWIDDDDVNPSEIAVLVSKQQELYCETLREAFSARGMPFRDEDKLQNLAAEPVALLIVDFLLIVSGEQQPGPYARLLDLQVFRQGLDDEQEYRARSRWNRFATCIRQAVLVGKLDICSEAGLSTLVAKLVSFLGRDAFMALAPEYEHGTYLQQQIDATVARAHELLNDCNDIGAALASFSGDRAVRIMSIHKSKGLEFDTVVLLGVENETFWADADAERSAFFVGISRAKRRLLLTTCSSRGTPTRANHRWNVERSEHEEFLGFAQPYLSPAGSASHGSRP